MLGMIQSIGTEIYVQETNQGDQQNGHTAKICETSISENIGSLVVFPVPPGIRIVQVVVVFGIVHGKVCAPESRVG